MKQFLNFINGEWCAASSGKFVAIQNRATGEVLGEVTQSTKEDVDRAVESAKIAQKSWRLVPAPERAEVLYKVAHFIEGKKRRDSANSY